MDGSSRMNVPGTPSGNWRFRAPASAFSPALAERLASLSEAFERVPDGLRTGG
jgi:4-alpha-glucanotransferase